MTDPLQLAWLCAGVNLLAGLHYTHRTVRAPDGGAAQPKPNPMSWGIWSLSGWLAFLGQISEGVQEEALLTLSVAAVPTFIFLAAMVSRKRYGAYAPIGRLDLVCGGLAVVTLIAWHITASGEVAVALSIACDALVAVPVVVQAYRDPASDNPSIWVAGVVTSALTLTMFGSFSFIASGFALYFLTLCLLVSYLLVVRPRLRAAGASDEAMVEPGDEQDEEDGAEATARPAEATPEQLRKDVDNPEPPRWQGSRRAGRRG